MNTTAYMWISSIAECSGAQKLREFYLITVGLGPKSQERLDSKLDQRWKQRVRKYQNPDNWDFPGGAVSRLQGAKGSISGWETRSHAAHGAAEKILK